MRQASMPLALFVAALALASVLPSHAARVRAVDRAGMPLAVGPTGDGWIDVSDEPGAPRCIVAGDHVPAVVPHGAPDGTPIALDPGAVVEGSVRLPDGRPVAGVTLRLLRHPGLAPCDLHATSDAAGAYRLAGLPPGIAHVSVGAPDGFLAPDPERSILVPAASRRRIDLKVHEAIRVSLRVLGPPAPPPEAAGMPPDAVSEGDVPVPPDTAAPGGDDDVEPPPRPVPIPVAGARVRILPDWSRFPLEPALGEAPRKAVDDFAGRTNAEGIVVLPPLPRRAGWRIAVDHAGLAPASVVLDLRGESAPPTVTLVAGGRLALRAVDAASKPLPGARMRLSAMDAADVDLVPDPPAGGGDGTLLAGDLPAGTYVVEISARGARPRLVRGVVVRPSAVTDLRDVLLEPGAGLSGTISSDVAPIEGASVTLRTFAEGARLELEATTDAAGRFAFEGLDPRARCNVDVDAAGFTRASRRNVDPGADLDIELQRSASLVVELVAPGLEDTTGTWISVFHAGSGWRTPEAEPVPDEPNCLRVRDLAPGTASVIVRVPGHVVSRQSGLELLGGEETRVRIELERGRDVAGQVVDADARKPIAGAVVASQAQSESVRTQDDGSFTLRGVRSPIDIQISHASFLPARLQGVDLDAVPASGLEIALERGGSVEGFVHGADGFPVAGAEISELAQDARGKNVLADADGHYRIDGLPAGTRTLQKVDRAGSWDGLETASVEVAKGAVARLDFGGGARLVGTVTFRGEPARGARLGLLELMAEGDASGRTPWEARRRTGISGDDGRYVVAGVTPGRHGLTLRWEGRVFGRPVAIAAGVAETRIDIDVPDLHLAGRVVDATGNAPLAGAHVSLDCGESIPGDHVNMMMSGSTPDGFDDRLDLSTNPAATDQTTADGSFMLLVSTPTACRLSAWLDGYEHWRSPEPFDVPASRDDMVVPLERKRIAGRLHVRLRDAATGYPLAGNIVGSWIDAAGATRNSQVHGSATSMDLDLPADDQRLRIVAWSAGRAIAMRDGIVATPDGSDIDVDLDLVPGGSVRMLVPEGSLEQDSVGGLGGDLHVVLASGFDPCADVNVRQNIVARLVHPVSAGEWLLDDLPAGPLTLRLGDAPPRIVDVVAGQIVEADLR